jgi:F0F1-type ATP synthase membrane subunit b/b'
MACFLVSYLAFSTLILKPYMRAVRERESRTSGSEETAIRIVEEAEALHADYEQKARAANNEVKDLYEKARLAAMHDYDVVISGARSDAQNMAEQTRKEISAAVQSARKTLSGEIPAVGSAIASKLAGKEISL